MRRRGPIVAVTSLAFGLTATSLVFVGCSPEQIADVATVTLDLGDGGPGGFKCTAPRGSAVCSQLSDCTSDGGDVAACFGTVCRGRPPDCEPLSKCLAPGSGTPTGRAEASRCVQNVCTVPAIDASRPITIVLDYIRLGGFPSCLATPLRAWCVERAGTGVGRPIPGTRQCFDGINLPKPDASASTTDQAAALSRSLVAALSNLPLDSNAPNREPVLVRVAALDVQGGCAELRRDDPMTTPLAKHKVIGCARSCPADLSTTGPVAVDFDACRQLDECGGFLDVPAPPADP